MQFARSLVLATAAFIAIAWSQASAACGGPQCICSDMRAFEALPSDPAEFSRLDFGYAVHDLDVGLSNFIAELQVWAGAGNSAVARAARELRIEVQTVKDCFCGRPTFPFLIRGTRGLDTFYEQLAHAYSVDTLINRNDQLQVRMRRIEVAYETLAVD